MPSYPCGSTRIIFDLAGKEVAIAQREEEAAAPGFWDDPDAAQQRMQELTRLKDAVAPWVEVRLQLTDLRELVELAAAEGDASLTAEIEADVRKIQQRFEELEFRALLSGPHDANNAILEINAGAGGTESCDWAGMLLRMYLRWAQRHGFETEITDENPGEVAGSKARRCW